MNIRTRFILQGGDLSPAQEKAVHHAFAAASTDAYLAARRGHAATARSYAETCRLLIAGFGVEIEKADRRRLGWL